MNKRVFIYRHAKSDWSAAYGSDHDRPLAPRGIESAKVMGRMLGLSGQVPELVITSTATRAIETLGLSKEEGKWACDVLEDKCLYYETHMEIFELVKKLPDKYSSVMLVGHEPKCSSLAKFLIGGGELIFKTATMARIDLEIEKWSMILPGSGELRWMQNPSLFLKGKFKI